MVYFLFLLKLNSFFSLISMFQRPESLPYSACSCQDITSTNHLQQWRTAKPNPASLDFWKPKTLFSRVKKYARFFSCEISEDALKTLQERLQKIVVGQDESVKMIINHISAHVKRTASMGSIKKAPLVLHFAGDFGVGKTLTASVISSYLFKESLGKDTVEHKATALFSGSNYLAHDKSSTRKKKTQQIRNKIIAQIKKCSKSIIIVNDLQKMDSNIFADLEDFFEGVGYTDDRKPIVTKDAIFIFTSDLGSADVSRDWSYKKLEREIKSRFNLYINFNKKLNSLVVHVPFKSLKEKEMKKIFHVELINHLSCHPSFECVCIDNHVIEFLLELWRESPVISKMNGRAFNKYIYPAIIENELSKLSFLPEKAEFNRLLKIEVKKLPGSDTWTAQNNMTKRKELKALLTYVKRGTEDDKREI